MNNGKMNVGSGNEQVIPIPIGSGRHPEKLDELKQCVEAQRNWMNYWGGEVLRLAWVMRRHCKGRDPVLANLGRDLDRCIGAALKAAFGSENAKGGNCDATFDKAIAVVDAYIRKVQRRLPKDSFVRTYWCMATFGLSASLKHFHGGNVRLQAAVDALGDKNGLVGTMNACTASLMADWSAHSGAIVKIHTDPSNADDKTLTRQERARFAKSFANQGCLREAMIETRRQYWIEMVAA